jgi:hypothetical protein
MIAVRSGSIFHLSHSIVTSTAPLPYHPISNALASPLISKSLFLVDAAEATFFGMQLRDISFDNCPLISLTGNDSHITITSTDSRNVTRAVGNGAYLERVAESPAAHGLNLTLSNVSFVECGTSDGNGGAIAVYLTASDHFSQTDSSYTACYARTSEPPDQPVPRPRPPIRGGGGALFLDCLDARCHFFVDRLEFKENTAQCGRNIAVEGDDAAPFADASHFGMSIKHGGTTVEHEDAPENSIMFRRRITRTSDRRLTDPDTASAVDLVPLIRIIRKKPSRRVLGDHPADRRK